MKKLALIILGVLGLNYAHAQDVSTINNSVNIYSNTPTLGSARLTGMGGAMGALGGDVSAINSNPASLGVYITNDVQATLLKSTYSNNSTVYGKGIDYSVNKNLNVGQFGTVLNINLFDRGISKWRSVNFGFNYSSKNIDNYIESPGLEKSPSYGGDLFINRHAYDLQGTASVSNLAIGGNYNDKIYAGLSLNFKATSLEQSDFYELRNSSGSTAIFNKQYTPYSEKSNGFSLSAGIIGRLDNGVRLGLAMETPTWWNMDRIYTQYSYDKGNNSWNSDTYGESRSITSPAKLIASVGYVPNKNLALDVDYTLSFSSPKISNADASMQTQFNDFMKDAYRSQSKLNVGGEYRVNKFRLRAGYTYISSPFKNLNLRVYDSNSNPKEEAFKGLYVSNENRYSAGLGYDFNPFYVDFAYQHVKSNYYSPYFAGDYASMEANFGVNNKTSVVSKVDNKQNNFLLTIGFRF